MKTVLTGIVALILLSGCTFVPGTLIESMDMLNGTGTLLMRDYSILLTEHVQDQELADRLEIINAYLGLSKEINDWLQKQK